MQSREAKAEYQRRQDRLREIRALQLAQIGLYPLQFVRRGGLVAGIPKHRPGEAESGLSTFRCPLTTLASQSSRIAWGGEEPNCASISRCT